MENILELVAVHGSQVETVLQDVEKTDVKQMKKKSKTQYICGSGCVVLLRLLFVFVLPLVDFLTDVVLVSSILAPALETTEICVSTSPNTYRGGRWSVNGEDCGLLDSQAIESTEELGGCPIDQRKPPRDGMCYDPVLHNLAFIEGDTTTRCQDSTTCDNVTYMKNENKGETIPGSSNDDPTIGDFIEITVCTARDDLNSTSCSPSCTLNPRTVSCTKCSECFDRESCRALNVVSNRSRDQTFVGESSVQINDETDICIWYGTDDTGYCGPYGLTGSCNVYQTDQFCRGALIGTKWCDLCTDGANCAGSQPDTSPDANGDICNSNAASTIEDVTGMVKCKSAYSKERIPSFTEYTNYDAKNSFDYMMRPINQAPLFDSEGYPTNTEDMCKKCSSCSDRLTYECGTREFYCCLCQSPISTGEWCCDTDEYKHLGSKQCGGNGKCYKNAPISDRMGQVSFAEKYVALTLMLFSLQRTLKYQGYAPDTLGNLNSDEDPNPLRKEEEIVQKLFTGEYDPVDYPFLSNQANYENYRRIIHTFGMFASTTYHAGDCYSDSFTSISCCDDSNSIGHYDIFGRSCDEYKEEGGESRGWCDGNRDDADFNASDMCCECGGGNSGPQPRNYSCEYEYYQDLIQNNAEACWSYDSGNCAGSEFGQEKGGIRWGKSQFEETGYIEKYWYCESSSNGALPKVYHRFYTVSTGSSGTECQGVQASFGVDLNNDETFVGSAAMSSAGIPLSCGSMDETTGCSGCCTLCSSARVGPCVREYQSRITLILVTFSYPSIAIISLECYKKSLTRASRSNTALLPIVFLNPSLASVLGAELNNAIAIFLILLMVIIIIKELVGLIVVALVIFSKEESVGDFNFVEIARDSIVGLVLVIILSIMDRSYIGRALTSDDEEDDSKNKLNDPYPKIMSYVWMPLEYSELFMELIFSILWIQSLYSDAFYEIPKGSEVDVILMSWGFAMFDLFMFRVPMLVGMMNCSCCCSKKKKEGASSSKFWNAFMFSLYVVCALLGTVVYIIMYNIRYDYCWEMDDGVSTQGFGNDFFNAFCESTWTFCPYTNECMAHMGWFEYSDPPSMTVPESCGSSGSHSCTGDC